MLKPQEIDSHSILNGVGESIFITDRKFIIKWANRYTNTVLQDIPFSIKRKEDLYGLNVLELFEDGTERWNEVNSSAYPKEIKVSLSLFKTVYLYIEKWQKDEFIITFKLMDHNISTIWQRVIDNYVGMLSIDRTGRVLFGNNKSCKLLLYSSEEQLNQVFTELFFDPYLQNTYSEFFQAFTQGEQWDGALEAKRKDGRYIWIDAILIPIKEDGGNTQYVLFFKEASSDKLKDAKLKKALKELSAIKYALDQSSMIAIYDENQVITYVNEAFSNLVKYSKEELLGKHYSYMMPKEDYNKVFHNELMEPLDKGKVWKGEVRKIAKDGRELWFDTTVVPFLNKQNKPYQYVSIQMDITYKKKTEELLQRAEKLSVIGELAAGVAHEIRNPLTSIKGFAQLLEGNDFYKQIILDEIDRISSIVSEFMVLAKPHAVNYSSRDIGALLRQVITFLESEANLNNVSIHYHQEVEGQLKMKCEENQLKQVFLNLIKNSIEAMPNGGPIHVILSGDGNKAKISISDYGVGMTSDKLEKLGEPFFSTKEEGNGLGLMVSYKIIHNHGGDISVRSKINQGTTFTITLPLLKG
ncbi:PAS domain-containing sensor histidine kinase [Bacillus sp. FJAT-44742]|uniref:PAS domain-containing sensor histidine kinase n=1 Tax=Bacillus sp. FJAT-44742 TaxID=2014005 RepID=UPI000C23FD69|nr:PAS domain-containing sensor histidine kinase [Bacillus sp. FJAT-44742]